MRYPRCLAWREGRTQETVPMRAPAGSQVSIEGRRSLLLHKRRYISDEVNHPLTSGGLFREERE